MRYIVLAMVLAGPFCLAHCGGDDFKTDTAGQKACKAVAAKLDECHLTYPAGTVCRANTGAEICAANCLAEAPCAEIASAATDTSYFRCIARCSGVGDDDFICANKTHFVPRSAVCNGISECPDGSDEADCNGPDAGM